MLWTFKLIFNFIKFTLTPSHCWASVIHSPEPQRNEHSFDEMHVVFDELRNTVPAAHKHVCLFRLIATQMCEQPALTPIWAQLCSDAAGGVMAINSIWNDVVFRNSSNTTCIHLHTLCTQNAVFWCPVEKKFMRFCWTPKQILSIGSQWNWITNIMHEW